MEQLNTERAYERCEGSGEKKAMEEHVMEEKYDGDSIDKQGYAHSSSVAVKDEPAHERT